MDIQITGLEQVQRNLAEAPAHIVASSYTKALDAGIKVIEAEVAARTPVQVEDYGLHQESGSLLDHIMTTVEIDSSLRGGVAKVGFGKYGQVANWVEYGHRQVTHQPGKREVGFTPAHPFMRPALAAAADAAIEAFAETLAASLEAAVNHG